MKLNKNDLVAQSKILTPQFSELLGLYFVCEKIAKKLALKCESEDSVLKLAILKKAIKTTNLNINEEELNRIFNTGWKTQYKNEVSFRHIRNCVCHACSISCRDFAVRHYKQYLGAMQHFFDEYCKRFG